LTRPTPAWLIAEKHRIESMRIGEVIIIDSTLNHSTVWRQLRAFGKFKCSRIDSGYRIERKG